jgi:hypothetical protein
MQNENTAASTLEATANVAASDVASATTPTSPPPSMRGEDLPPDFREGSSPRFYQRRLYPMKGYLLLRYDQHHKILGAFAGHFVTGLGGQTRAYSLVPKDLFSGDFDPRMTDLGEARSFLAKTCSTIAFEQAIRTHVGGVRWGLLHLDPDSNCTTGIRWRNYESYLFPDTWREAPVGVAPPHSGGGDWALRLSPDAVDVAKRIPSAWNMMIHLGRLFGGLTQNVPSFVARGHKTVLDIVAAETAFRAERSKHRGNRRRRDGIDMPPRQAEHSFGLPEEIQQQLDASIQPD